MYSNTFYHKYSKNVYSQNGEDGILEEILSRLNITNGYVCEFGAWDGKHFSNTFNLIQKGYRGVFIEGDKDKYKDLLLTCKDYPNIIPINAYVDHNDTENSLDNLLKSTNIPEDFDVLSIDIDSFDYQVWKSLKLYKPKIVIIEINSGVMTNNENHIHTPNIYQGTGFRPMFTLGIEKGYKFVLHTGNMIFVKNDLFDKLNIYYQNELDNFVKMWGGR
jgi:hypothetical protein